MSLFGTNTVASHWGWQNRWYESGPIVPPWGGSPQTLTASDGKATDYFGYSVDMTGDGNYCVVGATRGDTATILDTGAAYVYIKIGSTFVQQTKLLANDAAAIDRFGSSVGINSAGDTIIVGAYIDDGGTGSAYIFTRTGTTWTQQAKLLANNANTSFGTSVSISADGNTVVVGANSGGLGGGIYVYTRTGTTWTRQQTIMAAFGIFYGYSVSMSADGNTIIVGAKSESISPTRIGTAYIYTRTAGVWTLQQKLLNPFGNAFGAYVNISGDGNTVVIGSDNIRFVQGTFTGPHVYTRSSGVWSLVASIGPNTNNSTEQPSLNYDGTILSITGDGQVTFGAPPEMRLYSGGGATWNLENTVTYPSTTSTSVCNALDNSGTTLIVGIQDSDIVAANAGAAYIYTK